LASNHPSCALSSGDFVLVVSGSGPTDAGNYNLLVTTTGCTSIVHTTPTAIALDALNATSYESGTLVEWQTGFETDNLGFNVHREVRGKRTKLTKQLIAGSALLTGAGTTLTAGRAYSWWDGGIADCRSRIAECENAVYWLEEVGLDGQVKWHGPVTATGTTDRNPPPGRGRALLLSSLTSSASSSGPVQQAARPPTITPGQIGIQSNMASEPALKLSVKQEGWYRISQQDLLNAGLDPGTDPRNLQLFADGNEQPILVHGEQDGKLDPNDGVEFYGLGLDTFATDSHTYWLVAGSQAGKRVTEGKARAKREPDSSFAYTVERRDRTIFIPSLKTENYYGAIVGRDPIDQVLNLVHADLSSSEKARIDVSLQGVTVQQHKTEVLLNGKSLGEITFEGQSPGRTEFPVPHSWLKQGENKVTLRSNAGDLDFSVVDAIRITYQHSYRADGDTLRFTASPKQRVTIDGFTGSTIRVIDVTDPNAPSEITGRIQQRGSDYSITIGIPKGGNRILLALADGQAKRPSAITSNNTSKWRDPANKADLLIITHRDFLASVKPLAALRESQGLNVAVADVEDIYDEFSYGNKTAQAIRDFLLYTKSNWHRSPRFALLVGDATNDPRNFLGKGDFDFLPTKMIVTQYNETSSDGWFADFAEDGLPQIAIGRLPVRSAQEADLMIAKIIDYDRAHQSGGVLLVSDSDDGFDFEGTSTELRSLVPFGVQVDELRRIQIETGALRVSLMESLNQGARIVSYVGHGSVEMWRGGIFTPADARSLTNSQSLTFFMAITCLNGYFQDPAADSMAESLMKAERGGAVAVLASSGFVEPWPQAAMARRIFQQLFSGEAATVGEMINNARASVSDMDVRRTYMLFGDPSARLK
jgi:hypothetical protein